MLNRLRNLHRSQGLAQATTTTLGNFISTALGALAIILISRLSTPSDFGIFSVIFSMMLMVSKLGDLGSNVALQRSLAQPHIFLGDHKRQVLASSGLYLKLTLAFLTLFGGIILSPVLSAWLSLPTTTYIILGFFAMVGIILFDYFSLLAQAESRFALSVWGSGIQSVIKIIAVPVLYYYGLLTPSFLIILYGLAPALSSLYVASKLGFSPLKLKRQTIISELARLVPVMRWTFLATISSALADNIDVLLVQSMVGSVETGYFSAAFRIASFAAVASYSVGVVLNIRVAKYKTKEHLDSYLKKAVIISLLALIFMIFVAQFSYYLILFTAGESYLSAVPSLQLLLYSTGFLMATTPFVSLFYTLDSPSYFGVSGVLTALLLISSDYLLIPAHGIYGAGLAKLLTRAAVFVFTLFYVYYSYRQKYAKNS